MTNAYSITHPATAERNTQATSSIIGIIEADAQVAEVLTFQIRSIGYHLAWVAENKAQAIEQIQDMPPDVVLLHLDQHSGTEGIAIAHYIRKHTKSGIIFLSDGYHCDHVQLAKPIRPDAFLLKPVSTELLVLNIEMAMANHSHDDMDNSKLMVKVGYKQMLILLNDLEYISSEDNYLCFHLHSNRRVMVRSTIGDIMERLDPKLFVRVNRGTILSIRQVSAVEYGLAYIGKQKFVITKTYRAQLLESVKLLNRRG
jgi:DNA-binding LytR/AlgR family response regulator